ncbi:hypothetical protein FGK64_07125 [Arenibacterium halophilum]|uniref:TetR family transcriptional regulator n=2 Tax=Arenibacterium halophilum TaxID=2583821 RepID=A0ABY2XBE3_9RHOB|nr:hypothetical protein FGK64_07125 [Arenibacterium halophilum]
METGMTPAEIETLFDRGDAGYVFARWGRPLAPVVFGVQEQTLGVIKGAFEAIVALAGHNMAEVDPELGSNVMVFFLRDWDELLAVPDLAHMLGDLPDLVARLNGGDASQYRTFRFDDGGAIRAAFVFLRMRGALAEMAAEDLALSQAVQVMLLWSDQAFAEVSPLAVAHGQTILRPEIAGVIRAAYDPVMPAAARDASHALRLSARLAAGEGAQ